MKSITKKSNPKLSNDPENEYLSQVSNYTFFNKLIDSLKSKLKEGPTTTTLSNLQIKNLSKCFKRICDLLKSIRRMIERAIY